MKGRKTLIMRIDKAPRKSICKIFATTKEEYGTYKNLSVWDELYFTAGTATYTEKDKRLSSGIIVQSELKFSVPGEENSFDLVKSEYVTGNKVVKIVYDDNSYRIIGSDKLPVRFDYSTQESPTKHIFSVSRKLIEYTKTVKNLDEAIFVLENPKTGSTFTFSTSDASLPNWRIGADTYETLTPPLPTSGDPIDILMFLDTFETVNNVTIIDTGFESLNLSMFSFSVSEIVCRDNQYLKSVSYGSVTANNFDFTGSALENVRIQASQNGAEFNFSNQQTTSEAITDSLINDLYRDNHSECVLLMSENTMASSSGREILQKLYEDNWTIPLSAIFDSLNGLNFGGANFVFFDELVVLIATNNIGISFETVFETSISKIEVSDTEVRWSWNGSQETFSYNKHSSFLEYSMQAGALKIDGVIKSTLAAGTPTSIMNVKIGYGTVLFYNFKAYNGLTLIDNIIVMPNGIFEEQINDSYIYLNGNEGEYASLLFK